MDASMKKINAVWGWLSIIALLGHLVTMSYSLLTGWYDFAICKALAYATAITVGGHVVFALIVVMFLHDGANLGGYAGLNKRTILQRASGIAILVLLVAHVHSFGFITAGEPLDAPTKAFIIVTEVLFFAAICTHLATSFSKSLITWGLIREESTERRVNLIAEIVCAVLFVVPCFALVRFVLTWMT